MLEKNQKKRITSIQTL